MSRFRFLTLLIILLSSVYINSVAQSTRKSTTPKPKTNTTKQAASPSDSLKSVKPATPAVPVAIDDKPLRKEIEAKESSDDYKVITAGRNGMVTISPSTEKKKGKGNNWDWVLYNTQFEEQFTKTMTVNSDYKFVEYDVNEQSGHIYALFSKAELNPSYPAADGYVGKFEIHDFDLKNKSIEVVEGEFLKKIHVNVFKVVGSDVYIGGSNVPTKKQLTSAACVAMMTCLIGGKKRFDILPYMLRVSGKKVDEINFKLQKQGEILSVDYDSIAGKTYAAVIDAPMPITRNMLIFELNSTTTAGKSMPVKSQPGFVLLNGQLQSLSESEKVIMGSYTKTEAKDKVEYGLFRTARKTMPPASGFFIAKMTGTKQDYIKFYPFSKFSDMQKSLQKAAKGNAKKMDKMESRTSYNLLLHKLIVRGDELVMIGDVYTPHYTLVTDMVMDSKGNMRPQSRWVFDGWLFTNSLLAGFDKSGDMKWNSSFDLPDKLSPRLKPQIRILQNPGSDNIVMVYNYGGSIQSKILNGQTLESGTNIAKIETANEKDQMKSSSQSQIEYWYDNFFIAFGFEKIKSAEKVKGKSQLHNVFYLNKIAYR